MANSLISMVGQGRIELPTLGFSVLTYSSIHRALRVFA